MGLIDEDKPGQAMFFSPGRITAVRARQEELEAQKEQERLAKEEEKKRRVIGRELKAQEARERKEAKREKAAQKRAAKIHEKETRALQKQANRQLIYEQSISKISTTEITRPKKRRAIEDPTLMPPSPKSRISRSGRKIALPSRFCD